MNDTAREIAELATALPPAQASALVQYTRFLAERADEEEWDRRFESPRHGAKLEAMASTARAELHDGKTRIPVIAMAV